MIELLRYVGQSTLGMTLWAFLLLFAPVAVQAQATAGSAMLDNWRSSFNQQLDSEIVLLASTNATEVLSTHNVEQGEQEHMPTQASSYPELVYREAVPWSPAVRTILRDQGLPTSLIGVVAVESGFNPMALSPRGAAGPWQLMPGTARQYGLTVNAGQDDRFDVLKSTVAAAHYLRRLYSQFGDWPLALAAYNAGPKRVEQGLDRSNAHDFWTLSRDLALPGETRSYVPRVFAAMRGALVNQDLESQHNTSWNRSGDVRGFSSTKPYLSTQVVFATTTPQPPPSKNVE
jgi:soluble lytic murein transglycosylase-like protein